MNGYSSKLLCLKGGTGHFESKFQGQYGLGSRPTTTVGVRKLESLGYITWRHLRDAIRLIVLTQPVSDRHRDTRMHTQTHGDG